MKKTSFLLSAVLIVAGAAHADIRVKCDTKAEGQGSIFLSIASDIKTSSYQLADAAGLNQLAAGSLACQGPNESAYACSGEADTGIAFGSANVNLVISESVTQAGVGSVTDTDSKIDYSCEKAPGHELKGSDAENMEQLVGGMTSSNVTCFSQNGVNFCYSGNTRIDDAQKDSQIWKLLHHAGYLDIPNQGSDGAAGQPTISGGTMKCTAKTDSTPSTCSFSN